MPWDWSHPWAACSRISGGRLEIGLLGRRGDFLAFAMGSTADKAPGLIGQGGGEVTFSRTATDGDDQISLIFWAFCDLHSYVKIGAGRDPDKHTFFFADAAGHGEGVVVTHGDHLIDDIQVEIVRDEACARALNFVGAGFDGLTCAGLGDYGGVLGLNSNSAESFFAAFDDFRNAGERSTGADGRNEDIDQTICIGPDFFGGGFSVNGGVGRIFKLLGNKRAGDFFGKSFGSGDGALHPLGSGGELQLRTEEGEKRPALEAHTFRHGEDEFVSFGGGNESEGDPGVS